MRVGESRSKPFCFEAGVWVPNSDYRTHARRALGIVSKAGCAYAA
jgi:hypothetical protein